jgi:predicted ATPase/DNA-binding SARP family transcriptional activator
MTTFETTNTSLGAPFTPGFDLPVHLTGFVGRDRELSELQTLVPTARLLTLTGAGGSGKTRLARELAVRAGTGFGRVGWVDLAPIATGDLVAQQMAVALHIHERPSVSALDLLVEALRPGSALIVIDNCEHVVDATASIVEALLRACPALTVLATSREALGVASETAWLVPPLATSEAIQLFAERARLVLPTFVVSDSNRAAVSEICRRLDGIPLAIELAAPRVRVLSPEQIASRLDDAFHLLSAGSRTALPRHRTLRATMEWSHGLLRAREQVLLRRLSVFAGSFTLDAAESVCADDPLGVEDILDGVTGLVDKSLVVMEPGEGVARYRLLETVRQYGAERLEDAGETNRVALRFAQHCIGVVEAVAPFLVGGARDRALLDRLSEEHDNVRAALAWACADVSHVQLALRFIGGLGWFWYAAGQFREARQFSDRALARDATGVDPLIVGRAYLASALTAFFQGESDRAIEDFQQAIRLLRETNDAISMGTALSKYGAARLLAGQVDASIVILDEAVEFIRDTAQSDITRIFAVFWRGLAAYVQGDVNAAADLVGRVLAIGREFGLPTTTGHSLTVCALIELARDNVDEACALVSEALEIETASEDGWGIAIALDVVMHIAARRGRLEDAVRLAAGVDAHRKRMAVGLPGLAPRERDALFDRLRATPAFDFNALYSDGFASSTEQTVAAALAETSRHTTERRAAATPAHRPVEDTTTDRARLRVLALGPLQVFVDDRLIDIAAWGSARPRELLVYLLIHPEGRTKEQVGLAFWPEASTSQLRNNFHVTLHRLRKALGGSDWVSLVGERYRVDPQIRVELDVASFERDVTAAMRGVKRKEPDVADRLEQTLRHYRGDLLDGEPVGDWHLEHHDRLQRVYVDGLIQLGALSFSDERYTKAAEAYRRVLARDELHEDALVALMRCHAAVGERAQALRIYSRYVERLREELDAEPGDEAQELAEQLQQGATR